jgi:histone H3/H4
MSQIAAILAARQKKKNPPQQREIEPEPAEEPAPSKKKAKKKRKKLVQPPSKEWEEEDDHLPEEHFTDSNGLDPLFKLKRGRAVMTRHGFSKAQPEALVELDQYLKNCLREVVGRSLLTAASRGRTYPNQSDAITAIQEMGQFPSVILG